MNFINLIQLVLFVLIWFILIIILTLNNQIVLPPSTFYVYRRHEAIDFMNTKNLTKCRSTRNHSLIVNSSKFIKLIISNSTHLNNISKRYFNDDIEALNYLDLINGGEWHPKFCRPKELIALIVPYRRRIKSLNVFLNYMHQFLSNQNVNYKIYLVEPILNITFNRGLLMNIGFVEALKDSNYKWKCFFFHDVDMLPEHNMNRYRCNFIMPIHYAVAVRQFGYSISGTRGTYYGGVNAFTREQFKKINGFSNLYFGWGREDDDLKKRVLAEYSMIKKVPAIIGRYYSLDHARENKNSLADDLLKKAKLIYRHVGYLEGLNTTIYQVKHKMITKYFTHFLVDYNQHSIFNESLTKLNTKYTLSNAMPLSTKVPLTTQPNEINDDLDYNLFN